METVTSKSFKTVCVLPAYNASKTLEKTLLDVAPGVVDLFVLVDDNSKDDTVSVAECLSARFPLKIVRHSRNRGYGGNQKTCYGVALSEGADVGVMLHPDYQYEPKLLGCMVDMVARGVYDVALGSRILGKGALRGGMPFYKYVSNRLLTFSKRLSRPKTLGIPYRLPGVFPNGARRDRFREEQRRLRF